MLGFRWLFAALVLGAQGAHVIKDREEARFVAQELMATKGGKAHKNVHDVRKKYKPKD